MPEDTPHGILCSLRGQGHALSVPLDLPLISAFLLSPTQRAVESSCQEKIFIISTLLGKGTMNGPDPLKFFSVTLHLVDLTSLFQEHLVLASRVTSPAGV